MISGLKYTKQVDLLFLKVSLLKSNFLLLEVKIMRAQAHRIRIIQFVPLEIDEARTKKTKFKYIKRVNNLNSH